MNLTYREKRILKKFNHYEEVNRQLSKVFQQYPCMQAIYNAVANMWSLAADELRKPIYEEEEINASQKE